MNRRNRSELDSPGYDSFLDIVANLVGILVILIMVLGVRAKNVFESADEIASVSTPSIESPAVDPTPASPNLTVTTDAFIPIPKPIDEPAESSVQPAAPLLAGPTPTFALPDESTSNFILPPLDLDIVPTNESPVDNTFVEVEQPVVVQPPAEPLEMPDVAAPRAEVEKMRLASYEIESQIQTLDEHLKMQKAYREELLVALSLGKKQVQEFHEQLTTSDDKKRLAAERLAIAEDQLANVQRLIDEFDDSKPEPIVLEHRPAPLAKTVFGHEEHFRLAHGKISYIPMNEINQFVGKDMKNKMWKLEGTNRIKETFGPVDGFSVEYVLSRRKIQHRTKTGPLVRSSVGIEAVIVNPVSETQGQTISDAMADDSKIRQRLRRYESDGVTVTIWVYPDSYNELRQFKSILWENGFLVASRPRRFGEPIGFSPNGTHSVAE